MALAFVVLDAADMPTLVRFQARLVERLPEFAGAAAPEDDPSVWMWNHRGGFATIALMDYQIPWGDLEHAAACSALTWPDATEALRGHVAHVLVSFDAGDVSRRESNWIVTQMAACMLDVHPSAMGVYWGDASLVHRKDAFLSFVESSQADRLAVPLWVAVRISEDKKGLLSFNRAPTLTVSTKGLKALGEMEIEAAGAPGPAKDLFFAMLDLASYLLNSGRQISDGDTIGPDAETKIVVRHRPSMWEPNRTVYRVEY